MIARYKTKEMAKVFSEDHKFKTWLKVEATVAGVQERMGLIPRGLGRRLAAVTVTEKRINEIERVTNHDVIAFLEAAREKLGKEAKWLHFGMTSYDLVDTALALLILEATDVIVGEMEPLLDILGVLEKKYRRTPQMGRTHGIFAQPITFGYKVASWRQEMLRARSRIVRARGEIAYGKLSGAVGSYTILSPRVEKLVMTELGLKAEPVSTQVIPRDRLAYFISVLALYACGIERIATEIRNLSRSEIGEVSEPFAKGQKGSSAMPHKQNPITCERICGLVKVIRGYLVPVYENINMWHERDLTNSSVERIVIGDTFYLVHYITIKACWVLKNLNVFPEAMATNIANSRSVYASQQLMNRLIEKGMSRRDSYDLVQALSFKAIEAQKSLAEVAAADRRVGVLLKPADLKRVFDLNWFLRNIT
ncbi:MAG TPA: adenylosuccinate lyase [bacterium]